MEFTLEDIGILVAQAQSHSGTVAIYNNNNRITISSGKIYVPVAGRYLVHVQGLDNSSNTSFDTRIQQNVTVQMMPFLQI